MTLPSPAERKIAEESQGLSPATRAPERQELLFSVELRIEPEVVIIGQEDRFANYFVVTLAERWSGAANDHQGSTAWQRNWPCLRPAKDERRTCISVRPGRIQLQREQCHLE
jgi:hypothetical protein